MAGAFIARGDIAMRPSCQQRCRMDAARHACHRVQPSRPGTGLRLERLAASGRRARRACGHPRARSHLGRATGRPHLAPARPFPTDHCAPCGWPRRPGAPPARRARIGRRLRRALVHLRRDREVEPGPQCRHGRDDRVDARARARLFEAPAAARLDPVGLVQRLSACRLGLFPALGHHARRPASSSPSSSRPNGSRARSSPRCRSCLPRSRSTISSG